MAYTALVVDPDRKNNLHLCSLLSKSFRMHDVYNCTSASAAVAVAKGTPAIDWVMVSNELRDMSMTDLMMSLRGMPSSRKSNYVMLSNSQDQSVVMQAMRLNMNQVLYKPYTKNVIKEKVTALLSGQANGFSKKTQLRRTIEAEIVFQETVYTGILANISPWGCIIKSKLFNRDGGRIYENADLNFIKEADEIELTGKLVKMEKYEASLRQRILATFEFNTKSVVEFGWLTKFMAQSKRH